MITAKDFRNILDSTLEIEIGGGNLGSWIDPDTKQISSNDCYELAKRMAIEFSDFILNESFVPSFNSMGERSFKASYNNNLNKSPEELFELYIKENT